MPRMLKLTCVSGDSFYIARDKVVFFRAFDPDSGDAEIFDDEDHYPSTLIWVTDTGPEEDEPSSSIGAMETPEQIAEMMEQGEAPKFITVSGEDFTLKLMTDNISGWRDVHPKDKKGDWQKSILFFKQTPDGFVGHVYLATSCEDIERMIAGGAPIEEPEPFVAERMMEL